MKGRVHVTLSASRDIQGIAHWIASDSESAAVNWVQDLTARFSQILQMPGTGSDRSDLRPGMRSSPFGNYLVFFRKTTRGITIVRVLHGARDYERLFRRS